jgi:NADP-dependent 3-hydroxy acid dehydrogenase YdfG
MKYIITGHSKGIGKSIFEFLQEKNLDITGISRKNGWDINDYHRCAREIEKYDCFINNAYSFSNGYSQTELLRTVWEKWQGKEEKLIINIGSYGTEFIQARNHPYTIHKHALDQTIKQLRFTNPYPKIINIKPGYVNTERIRHIASKKIEPVKIGFLINFILENRNDFHILDVTLVK